MKRCGSQRERLKRQPLTRSPASATDLQSLKGLSRGWKEDVGERALTGLLDVLANDAEVDADIGKATLETLVALCEVEEQKELGFKHTDVVLATDRTVNTLFALLADNNFYTRFETLHFLSILLQNRRQVVQGFFLKAPAGSSSIMAVLEDKREMIRNEAINMVQTLIVQSADIQKVLAFEGAFEKLFNIVTQEGGVEGGVVAQQALSSVDALLRFNTSNQSYFRHTPLPPVLCSLLLYPPNLPMDEKAPQEFALQYWDNQKLANASLIVAIMGMFIGSSKGNSTPEVLSYTRCLVELALDSNAPTPLKTQALKLLRSNLTFPLSELRVTPYMPVPETFRNLDPTIGIGLAQLQLQNDETAAAIHMLDTPIKPNTQTFSLAGNVILASLRAFFVTKFLQPDIPSERLQPPSAQAHDIFDQTPLWRTEPRPGYSRVEDCVGDSEGVAQRDL
ncbi:hypothetical protein HMN09_01314700 [Mycena chlorophos]|uniref:Vesicle tethering protein Uso1/P115-like head domain-containing protein n=1 Tax=Mycena chlorophos TaxID=658473 RepID=A0A8H6S2G7_MYCCL|nr:hypothetical protein HMN09_01314700 [Mycena chlorophos]